MFSRHEDEPIDRGHAALGFNPKECCRTQSAKHRRWCGAELGRQNAYKLRKIHRCILCFDTDRSPPAPLNNARRILDQVSGAHDDTQQLSHAYSTARALGIRQPVFEMTMNNVALKDMYVLKAHGPAGFR
jgi:hypothetical protein